MVFDIECRICAICFTPCSVESSCTDKESICLSVFACYIKCADVTINVGCIVSDEVPSVSPCIDILHEAIVVARRDRVVGFFCFVIAVVCRIEMDTVRSPKCPVAGFANLPWKWSAKRCMGE